jgi:hypothetical protein
MIVPPPLPATHAAPLQGQGPVATKYVGKNILKNIGILDNQDERKIQ